MHTFEIYIMLLGLLYVYERVMIVDLSLDGRNVLTKIKMNIKPLNCIFCISFWVGVGFSFESIIFLSLPLVYRVVQLKLLK